MKLTPEQALLLRWLGYVHATGGVHHVGPDKLCCYCLHTKEQGHAVMCLYADTKALVADLQDDSNLPATTDRNPRALLTKAWYWLLNHTKRQRFMCREEYLCEWVYPYGFVPEGGCPWHD